GLCMRGSRRALGRNRGAATNVRAGGRLFDSAGARRRGRMRRVIDDGRGRRWCYRGLQRSFRAWGRAFSFELRASSFGVFHVGHNLYESFVSAREDRGEGAEFCSGLEAAPLQIVQFAIARGEFNVSEAELAPDGSSRVGHYRVEKSSDDADGLRGRVEDFV